MIELELPYPPTVNTYYRSVVMGKGVRVLISKEGREYREVVATILAIRRVRPLEGPLRLTIEAFVPDRRKRDIDNIQKPLIDSLEHGGAFYNDNQIYRIEIERKGVRKGGLVKVEIEEKLANVLF